MVDAAGYFLPSSSSAIPLGQFFDPTRYVIDPPILGIQVVGVFPTRRWSGEASCLGQLRHASGVWRIFSFSAAWHEPSQPLANCPGRPSTANSCIARRRQRCSSAVSSQAWVRHLPCGRRPFPVERHDSTLRCVVEYGGHGPPGSRCLTMLSRGISAYSVPTINLFNVST